MAAGDFTMTAIAPVLYSAAQTVSKEPTGALQAIDARFDDKGVAKGDYVYVPYTAANSVADYTPAAYAALGTAATASSVAVEITASKVDSWSVSGEQERSLMNGDNGAEWMRLKTQNAMRVVRNAAEAAVITALKEGSSRATGTAGTTPFQSDLSSLVAAHKILLDNGAPMADLQCVFNSDANVNLLNLGVINQAQIAGSDAERRAGKVGRQHGFDMSVSGSITTHTKGTATGFDCTAIEPVGETTIACDGSNSGTILAGDVVTRGVEGGSSADSNKYIVSSGSTLTGAASGNFIISRPGLKLATTATDEWTIGASYTPSFCFERSAVVGIIRPPLIPASAILQTQLVTDEFGLTYLFVRAIGDGIITYRVHLAYGFKVVQSEHVATILG